MKYNLFKIVKQAGYKFEEMLPMTTVEFIRFLELYLSKYKFISMEENGAYFEQSYTPYKLEIGKDGKSISFYEESEQILKNTLDIVYSGGTEEKLDYVKKSRIGGKYVIEGGFYLNGEQNRMLDYNIIIYDGIATEFITEYMEDSSIKDIFVALNQTHIFPDVSEKIVIEEQGNTFSIRKYKELQNGSHECYLEDDISIDYVDSSMVNILKEEMKNNPIAPMKDAQKYRK